MAQCLPADMEDKVVEFHCFVLRARQHCRYESSQILNMDETTMRFELLATRTLEFTGNRTVPILSCGGIKQSFTVVLAVKADGEKLPRRWYLKAFVSYESRWPEECRFLYTRWLGWRKVCSFLQFSKYLTAAMTKFSNDLLSSLPQFVRARLGICLIVSDVNPFKHVLLARSPFAEITLALFTNLFAVAAQLFFLVFIVY